MGLHTLVQSQNPFLLQFSAVLELSNMIPASTNQELIFHLLTTQLAIY